MLDTAESMKEIAAREIKKVPTLRGKTVVNLFYEASTRTRTSFEIAGKWLSADVINFSASGSSAEKGESLLDTARNIEAMSPDVVVVRHKAAGAPALLARASALRGGERGRRRARAPDPGAARPPDDPREEGPPRRAQRRDRGRHHAQPGRALEHPRHDGRWASTVTVAGPPTLIPAAVPGAGREGAAIASRRRIADADVIMMLRLQHERMQGGFIPSVREYSRVWGLTLAQLAALPARRADHAPGPGQPRRRDRRPRSPTAPYSVILDQVTNGVAVRMAVLYLLTGSKAAA